MTGNTAAKSAEPTDAVAPLQEAILFISRTAIRPMLRQELKNAGIIDLYNVETLDACSEHLARHERALLVLDWDHGPKAVNQALRAAQSASSVDTRAIFLIASDVSVNMIAVAAEYNVSRIHTGEISRGVIQDHLESLMAEETEEVGLRAMLARVAETRRGGDEQSVGPMLLDLMKKFPGNSRVGCELAEYYIGQEQWGDAGAIVDMLVVSDPNSLRIQHLKARCLMQAGRFDEATVLLGQCKLINPFHVERLVDLGEALMQVGRMKEAMANFEEALGLDGQSHEAALGKAQCQLVVGEVNEALALLRQISSPREVASIFNNAAILAIRQSRFEQGLSLYRTAIASVGSNGSLIARLLLNLGIAYHKQSRSEEALDCFEKATRFDAGLNKARHNAAVIAARLGKKSDLATVGGKAPVDETFASEFDDEQIHRRKT